MAISPLEAATYEPGTEVVFNIENIKQLPKGRKNRLGWNSLKKYLHNLGFKNKKTYIIIAAYFHPAIEPPKHSTGLEKELATQKEHTILQVYINKKLIGLGSHLFDKKPEKTKYAISN